jgi:c-di-GMP-binding flagellar brake protein YcgR
MKREQPTEAEIGVLEALVAQGEPLTARSQGGNELFRAPLRFVDPGRAFLILDRSTDPAADRVLLSQQSVELLVEFDDFRIRFLGERPIAVVHEGNAGIRFQFPESVSVSRRRMLTRAPVPVNAEIRCVVRAGASSPFEAIVTDVGEGGIGMLLDAPNPGLRPGMVLPDCRLEVAGREPIMVDLEVRHAAGMPLEEGRHVLVIGCRFAAFPPAAKAFVADWARSHSEKT